MWKNIIKADFTRTIAIPIMERIFNSGVYPTTIYLSSEEFEMLKDEFLSRYGESQGPNTARRFKNAMRHNENKYNNAIAAYARVAGFEILRSKRVYD